LTLVLVGAVLFGSATFFYGLILDPDGWDGVTMQQLAILLVVVGTTTGALLGLLLEWVTGPSVKRWTRFLALSTVGGVLVGLVYGVNVEEVCEIEGFDLGACGWPFFGLLLPPWTAFGLWTLSGGLGGGLFGCAASRLTRRREGPLPAGVGSMES
jgi:hypothetical protein